MTLETSLHPFTVQLVLFSILGGLFATALMDLGASLGTKIGVLNKPNLAFLGRWMAEIAKGRFVSCNGTIANAAPVKNERLIGLIVHYAIGASLGLVYTSALTFFELQSTLLNALLFGFLTNIFPWLVMFPALGFGFLASKVPAESKLLRTSLINHLVYGLGLFLATKLVRLLI